MAGYGVRWQLMQTGGYSGQRCVGGRQWALPGRGRVLMDTDAGAARQLDSGVTPSMRAVLWNSYVGP